MVWYWSKLSLCYLRSNISEFMPPALRRMQPASGLRNTAAISSALISRSFFILPLTAQSEEFALRRAAPIL